MATILTLCKQAIPITTDAYDDILNENIEAAKLDLKIAGVDMEYIEEDELVRKAIITFVRANFGSPSDYERLKKSYDEQKGQLRQATGYTDWGDE